MRLIKNFSNSLFKSFSFTDNLNRWLSSKPHSSFSMSIPNVHVLLIDTSGETSHVSTYDITGIGLPTLSHTEWHSGITCLPLRLHPERTRPAEQCWQMLLPSVPAGRPAASATTPAGQALPAAAVPVGTVKLC